MKNKLTGYQQLELAKLLGWFWNPKDIKGYFVKEYKISLSDELIYQYKNTPKWKPIVENFREEFLRNMVDVPIANKKKRLVELQDLYDFYKEKEDKRMMQSILRDARDEMESKRFGDVSVYLTQVTNNDFSNMTPEQINEEKRKTLTELERLNKIKVLLRGSNAKRIGEKIEVPSQEEGI